MGKKKIALFYDEGTESGEQILEFLMPFDKRKSDIHSPPSLHPVSAPIPQKDLPQYSSHQTVRQEGSGKTSGDGDFWRKASQALLCAIIGYLVEVLPIEQRNFSNVLEILRMNNLDEYAYHQYLTFKNAPAKTALNILISTAVLISQYVDIRMLLYWMIFLKMNSSS